MGVSSIVDYYVGLLIRQYRGKPKAEGHVRAFAQEAIIPERPSSSISFSSVPVEGSFEFGIVLPTDQYPLTVTVGYGESAEDIQAAIRSLSPLLADTIVNGSISNAGLSILFGTPDITLDLEDSYPNSLKNSEGASVSVSEYNNDRTIPVSIMYAYNIDPTLGATAVGAQLDTVAKYLGISRNAKLLNGISVTLNDSDLLTYIRLVAVLSHTGAALEEIDGALQETFPGVLTAIDNFDMSMDYLVNNELVSGQLLEVLIVGGLLPKPMGVRLSNVIYAPPINKIFSFSGYDFLAPMGTGFNSYTDFNEDTHFLRYSDSVYPI